MPVISVEREGFHAEGRDVPAAIDAQNIGFSYVSDDAGENARAIIEELRRQAEIAAAAAEQRARQALTREAGRHTQKWVASIKAGTQIDVSRLLSDDDLVEYLSLRSEEFVGLIKNLTEDMTYRINREVLGSIFEGRSNADVAKALQEIEGIGRNRARLIARDQASKHNAAMNQLRQQQAGVTHYRWATILDGRERETHRDNDGRVFKWDDPPTVTGHPGDEINCRCRALAVLADEDRIPDEPELLGGTTEVGPVDPVVPPLPPNSLAEWNGGISSSLREAAQSRGVTAEALVAQLDDKLARLTESSAPWMRVGPYELEKILSEGRLRNQFETNTSKGFLDRDLRLKHERGYLGAPASMARADHPKYGYLSADPNGVHGTVEHYGDIAVRFRPSVRSRTTFTGDDSLSGLADRYNPSPLNAPSVRSLALRRHVPNLNRNIRDLLGAGSVDDLPQVFGVPYVEAQFWGSLNVPDIEEVVFHRSPARRLRRQLETLGIPFRVASD